ncbi:hypothetical protein CVD28_15505 [Bacillus sp. M6-12]|nr:hypothetical protein CVD28_15505 [Bacillus sp. M6-12]
MAAGIEKEEQADFLCAENCQKAQGNFFSRPLPAEEIEFLFYQFGNVLVNTCTFCG